MAELTRRRLASFCIESQRYVCMFDAEQSYRLLLEKGLKPEEARKTLPNSKPLSRRDDPVWVSSGIYRARQ